MASAHSVASPGEHRVSVTPSAARSCGRVARHPTRSFVLPRDNAEGRGVARGAGTVLAAPGEVAASEEPREVPPKT